MESDFGFDEYIISNTYTDVPKLESYDAQLYPSDGMGYMCEPVTATATAAAALGAMPIPTTTGTALDHHQQHQAFLPSSPDESSSSSCLSVVHSPPVTTPPLLSCSPTTTAAPPAGQVISEKLAQVNKLPESFLPEFHQYSKETYENGTSNSKKRKRHQRDDEQDGSSDDLDNNGNDPESGLSAAEMRRQIHIQSEQKRRAQIKDGFDELRQHLPGCGNKKMSKATLLHRTVQHLTHLKSTQAALLSELERLVHENEQLRKFQDSVLQKQALDRMYQMGAM
ncbi:hypothetical protein O0I10_002775 [Lichtheimia ornata]|uniref:BHLH domain-containing protein n=1 Tax=Lichtheimia ornata TaxID=688661 RepID=A0AAD7V8R4_9FUNG|nr:uncharacterized protein O0I10_002775 [Lichtheimia ornata]KAJ8661509.1 hypothetical protein O0I10_002775 [Lichtheimia ornata]